MSEAERLKEADHKARLMRQATIAAVVVALLLIIGKGVALWMTGSVAMLATLADSALDGAASLLNLVAVHHSLQPADQEHRFGHGKAEALSGLGQSIFIFGSAGFIVFEAIERMINPAPVSNSAAGVVVTVAAIMITLGLVAFQRHVVAQTHSLAIEADSTHYRGDLLMNIAALAAIILSGYFGWHVADPVFGLLIAGLIVFSATQIARAAYDQLMDHELSVEERDRIRTIALSHPEVKNVHDLRTRSSGTHTFVQLHIELDNGISLVRAHRISDDVEAHIKEAFPDSDIIIHQDPAGIERLTRLERN